MEDLLQFGAMGLLGAVLFWGLRYAIPTTVQSLTSSLDSLAKEVAGFRQTQTEVAKLLALLLSKEFGPTRAAELLKNISNDDALQPRPGEGRNQARSGKAAS